MCLYIYVCVYLFSINIYVNIEDAQPPVVLFMRPIILCFVWHMPYAAHFSTRSHAEHIFWHSALHRQNAVNAPFFLFACQNVYMWF